MIRRLVLFMAVLLESISLIGGGFSSALAQVDTAWVRRYNGPSNSSDGATAMAFDHSGNVYVTGFSTGIGSGWDYATIKYYPNGDTAWVRRYNGPGNQTDWAEVIAIDDSGYAYVAGWSWGVGTYYDYATIKYYPNGDTAWVRGYDGPESFYDIASDIAVDNSGNVYVTGNSYNNITYDNYATIKYKANGDTAWVRRYNGPSDSTDEAKAIAVDPSGNVYVTGYSKGNGTGFDYATIKYSSNGDTAWVRRYNGVGNDDDYATAIAIDDLGDVYVTGSSYSNGTTYDDYTTIKYYPNGDTAWVRMYNGPGNSEDKANAIVVDDSGNVYVTGESVSSDTWFDYATIKYNSNGDTAWARRYNNAPANSGDYANAITVDGLGNVYVTGYSYGIGTDYDYATVKYYPDGDSAWVIRYNGPADSSDQAYAIAVDDSGNVYVTGYSGGIGTGYDYAIIKYVESPSSVEDETQVLGKPSEFNLSQNYPNPFNPTTTIRFTVHRPQSTVSSSLPTTLKIFDVLGEEVRSLLDEKKLPGEYTVQWDGRNDQGEQLASGVYFYELRVGNHTSAKKMVLLK